MSVRVNIGCGRTPTPGWINFDNSLSVRLARAPMGLVRALARVKVLHETQVRFISDVRAKDVRFADAARPLPFGNDSVDVIYTSHMLEHLGDGNAQRFLREAYRALRRQGILRIAVPDIARIVDDYTRHADADLFMERTYLGREPPRSISGRLRALAIGDRGHQWMYDGKSLVKRLESVGFTTAKALPAGETLIEDPTGLDLHERSDESVYVEAIK